MLINYTKTLTAEDKQQGTAKIEEIYNKVNAMYNQYKDVVAEIPNLAITGKFHDHWEWIKTMRNNALKLKNEWDDKRVINASFNFDETAYEQLCQDYNKLKQWKATKGLNTEM